MSKEIGTLVVVVLKARNLRDKHTIHKQDVYAQATLDKDTKKTKPDIRGGQHPVWDEELRFPVLEDTSDEGRKLEVSCWSKEPRTNDLVGRGSVDISETLKTGEFDDWVPLQTEDDQHRGDIFLEMTFYSAAPPPQRRPSKWISVERLNRPASTYSPSTPEAKSNGHKTPIPDAQVLAAVLKDDALPTLPEEPAPVRVSVPSVPASLRPGGGALNRTSLKSNAGPLPPEPSVRPLSSYTLPRDTSPPSPAHHSQRPSLDSVPPYLRPGSSLDSVPPYLHPGGSGVVNVPHVPSQPYTLMISEPHIPPPELPAPYSSPLRPYASPLTPLPPSYPIPAPRYGSPPRAPPPADYGPRGGAAPPFRPPQVQISPHPQPFSPYGGNGHSNINIWDERRSELPDPYLQARYQTPLPLPEGAPASTPSYIPSSQPPPQPRPQSHSPRPQPQPQLQLQTTQSLAVTKPTQPKPKGPSREERDMQLALEMKKEEEERQRKLREQEERDMELARQLDLELNLERQEQAAAAGRAASYSSSTGVGVSANAAVDMPGSW